MTVRAVSPPPHPFDPVVEDVPVGTRLHRVYTAQHGGASDPSDGHWLRRSTDARTVPVGRFSFFSDDDGSFVPVIYAAQDENVALWETILRDRAPDEEDPLPRAAFRGRRLARIAIARDLRVASLAGADMARLRLPPDELTFADSAQYSGTVPWARAAWQAGFDGIRYVSRRDPSGSAYVFFADRSAEPLLRDIVEGGSSRSFDDLSDGGGFEWLARRLGRWGISASL